jgi:hypothetical protein
MKKIFFYTIALLGILLQSCLSIISNKYELNSKTPKLEKINVNGKEVYFLGMAHLAKKEFYDNSKLLIEDLQKKGFIFYIESVTDLDNKSAIIDTLSVKKIRKLIDLDLTIRYSNSKNPYLQKIKDKYDLIDQPKYEFFELKNYKRIDYSYTQLIDFYETKYEKIKLDSCDLRTEIRNPYNCETANITDRKKFTNEIILNMRNKLIVDSLLNAQDKKIVIIYGKMHLKGIKEYLKRQ